MSKGKIKSSELVRSQSTLEGCRVDLTKFAISGFGHTLMFTADIVPTIEHACRLNACLGIKNKKDKGSMHCSIKETYFGELVTAKRAGLVWCGRNDVFRKPEHKCRMVLVPVPLRDTAT